MKNSILQISSSQKLAKKFPSGALILLILVVSQIILSFELFAKDFDSAHINRVINQQDWLTRQQQAKVEENRLNQEIKAIKNEQDLKAQEAKEKVSPISKETEKCFPIKSIKLINAESLSKKQQNNLTSKFIGKCVDAKTLMEIIISIQNHYHNEGYVAAKVSVPPQNIQSGDLELNAMEGKIDEMFTGENKLSDKIQEFTAFGGIEGKKLSVQNINRLLSNNVGVKLEPNENDGEARIIMANDKKFPARASISYDNLGNEFTGIRRTSFSGEIDNLFSLNDSISLNYTANLNDDNRVRDLKAFSSGVSIPFGGYGFYYDYFRSEFRGTNSGLNAPLLITGFSQQNRLAVDRVFLSKGNLRISGKASLTTKSSASYLNYVKNLASERKLTIGNVALSVSNSFKNGVNLYFKPSYSRGLKILNAKQDRSAMPQDEAKAQFDYFKFYASTSKKFTVPKLEFPFLLATEIDSQYAKQTIFGTEQFSVGGYNSVRGFRENFINGDSGYNFRNKINFNLGSLSSSFSENRAQENQGFVKKSLVNLNKISVETFYDYGYVKNKFANNGSDGRLSGAGFKTIFDSRYFSASLTYSWAIGKSRLISSQVKENKLLYFELSTKCCG